MALINPTHELKNGGTGLVDVDAACATAASTAMEFANDGNLVLFVKNGGGAGITLTVKANAGDRDGRGGTANDVAYTVPAGKIGFVPFLAPVLFNNAGLAQVTLSSVSSVTYALARLDKIFGGT